MKVTVCGSISCYEEMKTLRDELVTKGHEVMIPELSEREAKFGGDGKSINFDVFVTEHGGTGAFSPDHEIWKAKQSAIREHIRKIEDADAILVANYQKRGVDGYIGGNTFLEMGIAFYLGKPIYVLHPMASGLGYMQEILGMNPILLEGDLSAIIDA